VGTYTPPAIRTTSEPWKPRWESLIKDANEWLAGRSWGIRLPLVIYLAYAFVQHLRDPLYRSFLFGWITVLIHELGHVILGWGPQFLAVAGGSLAQVGAPIASIVIFLRQSDYFGLTVGGSWLSFSLFQMATYIADAREFALDYVTVGSGEGEGIHDWDYMLTAFGLLEKDKTLALLTRTFAVLIGLASLTFGFWLLWRMYLCPRKRRSEV